MSSLHREGNGWKIQFLCADGGRRSLRIGRMTERQAEGVQRHVDDLVAAALSNQTVAASTAMWLGGLSDVLHKRLVRCGLAQERGTARAATVGALVDQWLNAAQAKESTKTRMEQAARALKRHFHEDTNAQTIDETDAETWRAWLVEEGYADATISRTVRYARQAWRWAMKRRLVESNPFTELRAGPQTNPDNAEFIDRARFGKVLEACPDAEWRALVTLGRIGGLRVPSEALALRWTDVDWANKRLRISSPKTAHHEGKGERVIPLFPEIETALLSLYSDAPDGAINVITRYRQGANLNPQLRKIIQRAGLTPWPRTWHNLRASRQTELATEYPLHTVCSWIGNTKIIAAGHYLQVTDADWQRAVAKPVQNPVQQMHAADSTPRQGAEVGPSEALVGSGISSPDQSDAVACVSSQDESNGHSRT